MLTDYHNISQTKGRKTAVCVMTYFNVPYTYIIYVCVKNMRDILTYFIFS